MSLLTEDIVLALPLGHRLAERTSIRLAEVAGEAFLSLKPGQSLRDLTDAFCLQAGFTPQIVFESDDPLNHPGVDQGRTRDCLCASHLLARVDRACNGAGSD